MKLWEDAELTQEFTNETMIWIDDLNGEEEDFGLNPIIETDTFWNMNFSIWMELKTLGGASQAKEVQIQIGPNCNVETFYVTGLSGEDLGFPEEQSLKTIQMAIAPDEVVSELGFYNVDLLSTIKFESDQPLCGNWYFRYRSYY